MKPDIIPKELNGKPLFDFLVKNEALIIHAKKSTIKQADSTFSLPLFVDDKGQLVSKAEMQETQINPNQLQVVVAINTTNWFDSHSDVHIPGLWKKSIADNKKVGFYLLNSHQKTFEAVIADGCEGSTKNMSWKELGIDLPGVSEVLVFKGIVDKDRNEYMFGQYQKRYVKKHSVGMRYIKIVTCIDDEEYPVQKENWDKYIDMVANRKDAEAEGFFWAVLEAQVIEGSAVLFASNCVTPTIDVSEYDSTKNQPVITTEGEPHEGHNETKSMAVCPNCTKVFQAGGSSTNCPGCGQYVSPNSTQAQTFDLIAAIQQTNFINY